MPRRHIGLTPFYLWRVLEDLSHPAFPANTQETETRLALYKEIRQALDSRKQAASHTPVKAGCVNFDYSRTRRCVGRQDLGPTNGTSGRTPVLPPDDEAGLQPKPLTTPPPIIATLDPTPRRDAAAKADADDPTPGASNDAATETRPGSGANRPPVARQGRRALLAALEAVPLV